MAEGDESTGDKTEASTPRHTDQARDAGNVPVSREVPVFASLAAALAMLSFVEPGQMREVVPYLANFIGRAGEKNLSGSAGLHLLALGTAKMILPMLLAAAVAGAVAVLAQTNLLFHMGALQPNFSRVNPWSGLKRVFGTNGGIEVLKSLVKLVLITLFIWISVRKQLPIILHLSFQPTNLLLPIAWMLTYKILIAGLFAHGIIAVADLALVRFRHAQSLRMTKQDVRDEFKDIDGNPHIKARIRRIRVHRWRKRMMAKVPTATVVITNPTHYAVALAYDRANNPAPRIVAKGVDAVAMRIRELARANNVPMVSNPPLARALFRLNLDAEIPAEHYKAVAEVIAYVWRLRRQAGAT